jgi:hypothetical protein
MNFDKLIGDIRDQQPTETEIANAAGRVRARLFPQQPATVSTGAIRNCADFVSLIPASLAGTLDPGRKLLLDVHTRECVHCRKTLADIRTGARHVVTFQPRKSAVRPYAPWALAATVLLTAGAATYWGFTQYPALGGGPRATLDSVEGSIYRISGATLTPLAAGAELAENDVVRTAKNSTAVLRLNDGSKMELNQRAQVFVTRTWSGSTIHLEQGNIIVEAAKQRRGTLRVATADCNISVKGTVFSVDAGTKGSRVAVVEGTVWVDHGKQHDVLHRGDLTSTSPDMGVVPVRREFEWSRNSAQYLALLGDFGEIRRQIAAIPPPGLRYDSGLLPLLPANIAATAAIPNLGGTVAQASQIFHDRLKQSATLAAWWNNLPAANRNQFETILHQVETASAYLGDEIVLAAAGRNSSPLVVAQLTKPGLDDFLKSQPGFAQLEGHMRSTNGLFIVAADPADLDRVGPNAGFAGTPLFARLTPAYHQGAGWLFGADLAAFPQANAGTAGIAGARFLTAESRTVAGKTENRASVTFPQNRQGVASWLSGPGPMGSLEFVSPDAGFAASLLLKSPALIADDIAGTISKAGSLDAQTGIDFKAELASVFAGEVTVALDGPLLPVPSWKIAAEVYYPDRLQASVSKLVAAFNSKPGHEKTGDLRLTQSDTDGRTFYRLQFEKLPWEADWTFIDAYWLAAANHELLIRSIQNRQTGYTLRTSPGFRAQLPHDGHSDFSAVIYHNLGQTLAPIFSLLGKEPLGQPDTPGVICFWAAPDRIDVATVGSLVGMNIESLLSLQGAGPLQMLAGAARQSASAAGQSGSPEGKRIAK